MLCNGSARPGHPGQLGSGLQTSGQGAFTAPLSLGTIHLLGFRIAFAYPRYSNTKYKNVNLYPSDFSNQAQTSWVHPYPDPSF